VRHPKEKNENINISNFLIEQEINNLKIKYKSLNEILGAI